MTFAQTIAGSTVLTLMLAVTTFADSAGRFALSPWAVAHAGTASTCDFLPAKTPPQIRDPAAGLLVDQPPLSCLRPAARHLGPQHSFRNVPQAGAAVTVANAADLARPARLLSRTEILSALAASAAVNQFSGLQSLHVADIVSAPDIFVAEAAPRIEITSIGPDLSGTAIRVRVWIPSEPRIPPFWISVRRAIAPVSQEAGTAAPRSSAPAVPANPAATTPETAALSQAVLIPRGKLVQVVMRGTGMRISASATALEAGRQGQRIRARSEYAGKVVLVTVLDAETVELEF
jgi:Chaperone for flagella basal body P-ring formation